MRKSLVVAITACLVAVSAVGGAAAAANAATDSGIHSKGCAGQWGKLTVYQEGSGNSFAPGDYSSSAQWNPDSASYRYIYDLQNNGSGGGSYRNVTNGNYTSLTASCSAAG